MKLSRFLVLLVWFAAGGSVYAQPDGKQLLAVGLIDIGSSGGCTGTLISENTVLTAGHCLMTKVGDSLRRADQISFHPSLGNGLFGDGFRGKSFVVHPVFDLQMLPLEFRLPSDIGLLRLENSVPAEQAFPLKISVLKDGNSTGFVKSFLGRSGGPARQRKCDQITKHNGMIQLACDVKPGESGAPYLNVVDGEISVTGVVTSRGHLGAQLIALVVDLGTSFPALQEAYAKSVD